MKEQTLLKIALLGSIIGIIILFTISSKIELKKSKIKDIEDKTIRLEGIISNIKKSKLHLLTEQK